MRYPKEVFSINELVTRENMRKYDEMMAKKYSKRGKAMIKDGWHDVTDDIKVYTENGMILRAITGSRSASVYKHSRGDGWDNACPMRYDTFRRGWTAGRYIIR